MLATKSLTFTLACVIMVFVMSQTTLAQNSAQDYIDGHNKARAAVGLGNVSWNNTVYQYAQTYANIRKADCQLIHSPDATRPYGENIYKGPAGKDWSAIDAVNLWVDEKNYYDYNTGSCSSPYGCGHYTQIVWRSSTQIGCARVVCDNNAGVFIICSYHPPGNYPGQKPY